MTNNIVTLLTNQINKQSWMGLSLRAQGKEFRPATMSASLSYFHKKQKGNEIKRTPWLSSSPPTNCINRANWNLSNSPGLTQSTHLDAEDDYHTGCPSVSHCQQQSFPGLLSPGLSYSTYHVYFGLYCYCPWTFPFNDHTRICQLFWIIQEWPGYGTDLPLSRTGHQISPIKQTFELFCALAWNLVHFFSKFKLFYS